MEMVWDDSYYRDKNFNDTDDNVVKQDLTSYKYSIYM